MYTTRAGSGVLPEIIYSPLLTLLITGAILVTCELSVSHRVSKYSILKLCRLSDRMGFNSRESHVTNCDIHVTHKYFSVLINLTSIKKTCHYIVYS
jgi:hypothetical protein